MDIPHELLVVIAKSFGLFYLLAMAAGVLVYAFWPGNRRRFSQAARMALRREDKP